MPFVQAGDVRMHYVEHGQGDRVAVFVHGNLGCVEWMDLVWPLLPEDLHVYALDWRGCGQSDKPAPTPDYGNYSMPTHARDLLAAMDALGIARCDLINHSTGAFICDYALLTAPERFGKVLSLDPVTPRSLPFTEETLGLFAAMKDDRNVAFAGLATAAPTLFEPASLAPGKMPVFAESASIAQREAFERVVERTRVLSDGIWFGTPTQLQREFETGNLAARAGELSHPRLVLWGEQDLWIPRADVEAMLSKLPQCELRILPGVGHAANIEAPAALAKVIEEFL